MPDTPHILMQPNAFPQRVEQWLTDRDWSSLENGIRAGLPVGLTGNGGFTVFEQVLGIQEHHGGAPLPESLLTAFMDNQLPTGEMPGNRPITAVALCAEYAQWGWMRTLLAHGFAVETAQWPALIALGCGRAQRRDGALLEHVVEPSADETNGPNVVPLHTRPPDGVAVMTFEMPDRTADTAAMRLALLDLLGAGASIEAPMIDTVPPDIFMPPGVPCQPGASALVMAIQEDDADYAIALLGAGAQWDGLRCVLRGPDVANVNMPLGWALGADMDDVVLSMLRQGGIASQLPQWDKSGGLTFQHPVQWLAGAPDGEDQSEQLKMLMSFVPPAEKDHVGMRALLRAAMDNNVGHIQTLLDLGIPVDAMSVPNGFQAIHQACAAGAAEAIALLLDKGAQLSAMSHTGVTAASMLTAHPELLKKLGGQEHVGNIRAFRPRR